MSKCYISLKNVNIHYPSAVFSGRSLKKLVLQTFRFQKPERRLDDVHALKDFSLEIIDGERLGIIGLNGAGKSTLLRTIAKLYPVRSGTVEYSGAIRALFDISLGFEIEATGRENIMYRGLMMGETPSSMRERMQEIIDFSELGDFIDYPIKTYSTGMLVRLAFSISTAVDGEILLLDEMLGAGDASFVDKARKRMLDMVERSNILVLVSHDMGTIQQVCNRCILINGGRIIEDGQPADIVRSYYRYIEEGMPV